jgi:hypothetical protein
MHIQSDHIHSYCSLSDSKHKELHHVYILYQPLFHSYSIIISKSIILFSVTNVLCHWEGHATYFSHPALCLRVLNFLLMCCCQLCDSFQCLENTVILGQWGPTLMSYHTHRLLYHDSNEDKSHWWHTSCKEKKEEHNCTCDCNLIICLLAAPRVIHFLRNRY